jgi:hypothetical protein|uniref:Uncharacterized protein n=1 Tax=Picea glauca TaxID=3330 RepID=A0A101LZ07_PICGL|nr:hypothetical protein ABT39_MTgene4947 [Picea glauca]QHR90374.1 hypothetical protein Q903MT_gene4397 [Picea sitchensis]
MRVVLLLLLVLDMEGLSGDFIYTEAIIKMLALRRHQLQERPHLR